MASPRVFLNDNGTLSVAVGYASGSLTPAETRELIAKLERGLASLAGGGADTDDVAGDAPGASVSTAVPQTPVQLQHVATVLNSLRPRLDQLPKLAMHWHEANLRLRLQHAGRQFDQRTIAKEAALAEHRHGTTYFRAGEDVGLGRYNGGHFYYTGERYMIVPFEMRTMNDTRQPEPVARRMF